MKEPIFKPGDRIYHPFYGWRKLTNVSTDTCVVVDENTKRSHTIDREYMEKMYSFTEYDPIKGGLSHERPLFNVIYDRDLWSNLAFSAKSLILFLTYSTIVSEPGVAVYPSKWV